MKLRYSFHDGGRKDAGYKGSAGDCVTRAIAIATGEGYRAVYKELGTIMHNLKGAYKDPHGKACPSLPHITTS